ncbi:MAG: hypothetical protein EOO38_32380 [Cytophagaceae bacterium]|nr:MAG: hypothetical protein EOO38_32380 [Cytophagaceae bacterium]
MNISAPMKGILLEALSAERDNVVKERARRANDTSRKWNDSDERIAIELDKRRDDLDDIIRELRQPSGAIQW